MKHIRELLSKFTGFEWDAGNFEKNWIEHKVDYREIEQAIINRPIALSDDVKHSESEPRFMAFGKTDVNRLLAIVLTIRGELVRAISARDTNLDKTRQYYEEGY